MIHQILSVLAAFTSVVFSKGDNGYDTYRIPAVLQAPSGDILAFAEARRDGMYDWGQIDLVMRRSCDGGRSWDVMQTIWHQEGYTCGNPAPVVDAATGRILLLGTRNLATDKESSMRKGTSEDTRRVFVMYSDDDGHSWSDPREITSTTKRPDWGWYATGPCHGIQLQHGKLKGRIVIPCDHTVIKDGDYASGGSHLIISDDGGETWRIGAVCPDGNECTVAETAEGELLINMRVEASAAVRWPGNPRLLATSSDGGMTAGPIFTAGLREPVCQGTMVNYTDGGGNTGVLLFCNPDDAAKRVNLTLKATSDCGVTWHKVFTIYDGPSAYSDLVVLDGGGLGVLYETGISEPYESIVFRSYIDWEPLRQVGYR